MPGSGDPNQKIECRMTFYLECKNRDSLSEYVNQKIEGHMTLYLEDNHLDSRSENRKQKMGCHTTSHLEGNIQIQPANTDSVSCLLSYLGLFLCFSG